MGRPQIEIEVDDATGRWSVDGIPMVLVPQHFLRNNHFALEAALGPEELERILHPAGYRSAYYWCEKEAAHHGLSGADVFRHYMKRMSQRGWAQFSVVSLEEASGRARVRADHSVFVDRERGNSGRKLCYMFAAWLEGSLEYVAASEGRQIKLRAIEVQCSGEGHADHCLFVVAPGQES